MPLLNKLLQDQVKRHFGHEASIPEALRHFIDDVNQTYQAFEQQLQGSRTNGKPQEPDIVAADPDVYEQDARNLRLVADILSTEISKRRKAEKRKKDLIAHLEASQKIASVGSWELDLTDTNQGLRWSNETYRIFGFAPKEVVPTLDLFYQMVPVEDKITIELTLKEALDKGLIYEVEHRVITKDGEQKIIYECAEIITEPATGRQLKMIGTCKDITSSRKAEEALHKTNYELKTLFESMKECVFTLDAVSNRIIQISPSCEDIYGYTVADFMRDPEIWRDVIVPEDRHTVAEKFQLLKRGEFIIHIYRIQDKHGNIKWLESRIKPTLDSNGYIIRLDGVTADITKRQEAELALISSEYRFRSLIENSADAIVVINERSEVLYASDSLYRIMGYTPDEIIGLVSHTFTHPDDMPVMRAYLEAILKHPSETITSIYRRRRKDGRYIWCEGSATNLLHVPSVNGIIVNFRDITERKLAEEALKKSNEELDKFVYSVSHDLRAPLSSMLGVVSLIETETTDQDIMPDLKMLKQSINRLDGFITDILDYSRNSRMDVEPERIDFMQLLDHVQDNLKHMASANTNVAIHIDIQDDVPFYSDATRVSVILNNLISNAIRYSDPEAKKPFVDIRIHSSAKEAVLVIRDNGIGIDPAHHGRIFDMFYRVSKKSVGSGLGLYIVKETVEKLHGHIAFESEPGKGTAFKLNFPNLYR